MDLSTPRRSARSAKTRLPTTPEKSSINKTKRKGPAKITGKSTKPKPTPKTKTKPASIQSTRITRQTPKKPAFPPEIFKVISLSGSAKTGAAVKSLNKNMNALITTGELIRKAEQDKISYSSCLTSAAAAGLLDIVSRNFDSAAMNKSANEDALICAAKNGHCAIASFLIENDVNIECNQGAPLKGAALASQATMVTTLLNAGANGEADDWSAFWKAIGHLEEEVVTSFLTNENFDGEHSGALVVAARYRSYELIPLIVKLYNDEKWSATDVFEDECIRAWEEALDLSSNDMCMDTVEALTASGIEVPLYYERTLNRIYAGKDWNGDSTEEEEESDEDEGQSD